MVAAVMAEAASAEEEREAEAMVVVGSEAAARVVED